jgi:hypothetical protein
MAAKDKAEAAASAARSAGHNPYVQRFLQDEELRDNMVVAVEAARNAYARLNKGKAPAKNLLDDKKLHHELKRTADALRDATTALRAAPKSPTPAKKKRKGGMGKMLLIAIVGGAVALAASEGLRNKVLDALFGAEEEFDYSSNTTPAPAPETAPAS